MKCFQNTKNVLSNAVYELIKSKYKGIRDNI